MTCYKILRFEYKWSAGCWVMVVILGTGFNPWRRRNLSCTTFQHDIGYSSHYIHTFIVHIEERKEKQNSDTERHGIPPHPPWFFYVPGVQLRYTGSPFYVPIRRTILNVMDMYNEKMTDMWEPAPSIEPAWKARRVTARPPILKQLCWNSYSLSVSDFCLRFFTL